MKIVRSTHLSCGWTDSECPFERTCLFVRTHTILWPGWFNQEMIFWYVVSPFWTDFEFVQNALLAWLNSLLFEHDFTRDLLGFYLWFIYGESHSRKASTSWFLMYSNDLPCILWRLLNSSTSWVFLSDLDIPLLFLSCSRMYEWLFLPLILLRAVPISPTIDTYTNSLVVSTLFWDNQTTGNLNQQTPPFDSFQNNVDLESFIGYRGTFRTIFSSPPFWKGSKGSRA